MDGAGGADAVEVAVMVVEMERVGVAAESVPRPLSDVPQLLETR